LQVFIRRIDDDGIGGDSELVGLLGERLVGPWKLRSGREWVSPLVKRGIEADMARRMIRDLSGSSGMRRGRNKQMGRPAAWRAIPQQRCCDRNAS
jgi:hypothetical protein